MTIHPRAKLGLAARRELCRMIDGGMSIRAAARAFNVSPSTAHKHWHRWLAASLGDRASLVCLHDRSSRPQRSPHELAAEEQERICAARRRTGWGPRLIAGEVGHPHATVWRALRRAGLSRAERAPREAPRRYEWPCPGDLLHMDTKRFQRFARPGWRVTGDHRRSGREKRMRIGHEFVHSIVDDHTRLAYSEIHRDERAGTVTAFTARALAFFEELGIRVERLMTDNAFVYVRNGSLRELLAKRGIRHLRTDPWRPQTNGKVERYQQTLKREWARGQIYRSSEHRALALGHWVDHYNRTRPHSEIGDRPPISRVHDLSRQDS
jgi:transposase InsO family protein